MKYLNGRKNSDSRWQVLPNGTLSIQQLRRDDSGAVWCGAVSEAGGLVARTRLEIVTASLLAPAVIELGPANQTLPLGSPATLTCQTEANPVTWWKDGLPVDQHKVFHFNPKLYNKKS